ncbi:hypothetical protein HRbin33_01699 [bacterium HR33]|nr:hypothetical protein HRbin33_01699 [bacterium HR33]
MLRPRPLFAYGTLQPGLAPAAIAALAARLRSAGEGRVRGVLYDLGPYPGVVLDPEAETWVFGTVLAVPDDSLLGELDRYEGPEFHRTETEALLTSGARLRCWIYEFRGNLRGAKIVVSGKWDGPLL